MGLTTDFTVDILPLQLLSVITALNRSLELRDVTSRAWTPEVNYGQYVTNPRDIDHLNNRLGGKRTWSPRRSGSKYRYPSRSCSPHRGETWSDPHSPMVMNRSPSSSFPWGRNPNLQLERFCFGCGSLDHILSDRKCTPTIEALRTSVVDHTNCNRQDIELFVEQFMTLISRSDTQQTSGVDNFQQEYTPRRNTSFPPNFQFEESLYVAKEAETFEAHITAGFS